MPLFSIIVPVYKVEQYLDRCVQSLLKQTFSNIEIILINDGSPDNCPKMCDDYAREDNRIVVIHSINEGLSATRNKGVKIAKGKYILFVDSDDELSLTACEELEPFTRNDFDIVTIDGVIVGRKGNRYQHFHDENLHIYTGEEYLLEAFRRKRYIVSACMRMYSRQFLVDNKLEFKIGVLNEDDLFAPFVFMKADKVINSNVTTYIRYIREESITTAKDKRKLLLDNYNNNRILQDYYRSLTNQDLRKYLENSIANNSLSLFYAAKAFQYGENYIFKDIIIENARFTKTKIKAGLYMLSPRLYWYTNYYFKKAKNMLAR